MYEKELALIKNLELLEKIEIEKSASSIVKSSNTSTRTKDSKAVV